MKIGIDVSKTTHGVKDGIYCYVYNLVKTLAKIDKDNQYILYPLFTHLFSMDYTKAYCPENTNFKLKFKYWPKWLVEHLWLNPRINKKHLLGKVDILHSTCFEAFKDHYGKLIVTIFDTSFLSHPQFHEPLNIEFANKGCINAVKYADKIIAISENTKMDLIKYYSCPPDKIKVIYLGADEIFKPHKKKEIGPILSKYNINKKYILNVGSIEPRKNLIGLIKAYASLPISLKDSYELIIIGNSGWLNLDIFEMVNILQLNNKIRFIRNVPDEDLPYLYNGASLFIYPSFYEGFGLPVLEAMQCGCPVITSNNSSLPEVAGDAALLIDPNNVSDIAKKMELLLNNDDLRNELAIKGLERAKGFSWDKCAKETLKNYEDLG